MKPETVGNQHRILISEESGRGAIAQALSESFGITSKDDPRAKSLLDALKKKEADGYQYEGAEASLELLAMQVFGMFNPPYSVELYRVIGEKSLASKTNLATAVVKARVGDKTEITAGEGNGPVNALDAALRRALESFFPALKSLFLVDYRVRVIDPESATGAKVRVVIKSATTSGDSFSTVGVSTDVIDASFKALLDSFAYHLYREGVTQAEVS